MIILVTIAALIVLVIIAAALSTLQNKEVHVAEYEIGADDAGFIPINIVLISDLHRRNSVSTISSSSTKQRSSIRI